jgi:hypothetical protein
MTKLGYTQAAASSWDSIFGERKAVPPGHHRIVCCTLCNQFKPQCEFELVRLPRQVGWCSECIEKEIQAIGHGGPDFRECGYDL